MREGGGHCRSSFCFFGTEYLSIHQLRKKKQKSDCPQTDPLVSSRRDKGARPDLVTQRAVNQ